MKSHRPSPLCSALTAAALSLAPLSCKDDKKAEDGKAEGGDKSGDDGKAGGDAAKSDDGGEKAGGDDGAKADDGGGDGGGGLIDTARDAAGMVAAIRDFTPEYPKDLDPLLDLVPADADEFVIVRDVGALVETSMGYYNATKASFEGLATEIAKEDPGDAADLKEGLAKIAEIEKALAGSGIDLSAGLVVAKNNAKEDSNVIIYGAAKADALPTMLTTLGEDDPKIKDCVAVASAAGYSVCAKTAATSYAPGSKAADLRKKLEGELPGIDLDRANIVAHFVDDGGKNVPIVVETGQGMAHVSFAVPQAREPIAQFMSTGKAPGLGLIGPGQPFIWGQVSAKALTEAGKDVPPAGQGVFKTVTGEMLMGGLAGSKGFAVLAGLNDPAPASGLIALASMGLSEIPRDLPGGIKLDPKVETVHGAQALRLDFDLGEKGKFLTDVGYTSEIMGFAAGKYGAITFGTSEDVVDAVKAYSGSGPSKDMLDALPAPLAKAIEAEEPVLAMHVPIDAMQSDATASMFDTIAASVPPGEMGKVDPKAAFKAFSDSMAPLSGASMWVSHVDEGPVFHLVVQGFSDPGTEEGKAALEAIKAVAGGADRKATYGPLAKKYASSPRASSYKARAGELGDPIGSAMVASGVFGALGAFLFLASDSSTGVIEEPSATPAVVPAAVPPAPAPK